MGKSGYKWLTVAIRLCYNMMVFFGQHRHQIDAKNRFRIPSKYRGKFGDTIYLMLSTNCIYVLDDIGLEKRLATLSEVDIVDDSNLIELKSKIGSNTFDVADDGQGRFVLPDKLIKGAKINKNIVSVGAINWLEIWAEEQWEEFDKSRELKTMLAEATVKQ